MNAAVLTANAEDSKVNPINVRLADPLKVRDVGSELNMSTFNNGKHLFVETTIEEASTFTISVLLNPESKHDKKITFSFVSRSNGDTECCDIRYDHDIKLIQPNKKFFDERKMPSQKIVSFYGGATQTPVEGSLTTLLLSDDYYK